MMKSMFAVFFVLALVVGSGSALAATVRRAVSDKWTGQAGGAAVATHQREVVIHDPQLVGGMTIGQRIDVSHTVKFLTDAFDGLEKVQLGISTSGVAQFLEDGRPAAQAATAPDAVVEMKRVGPRVYAGATSQLVEWEAGDLANITQNARAWEGTGTTAKGPNAGVTDFDKGFTLQRVSVQ